MNLFDYIPSIPDFPKPGVVFRDISPLLADPVAFKFAIQEIARVAEIFDYTHIVSIESRGFLFGSALGLYTGKGTILVRKSNKLPRVTHRERYGLEYGDDTLEVQGELLPRGAKMLLMDDILATGGTFIATDNLLKKADATVAGAVAFLELPYLHGREHLEKHQLSFVSVLSV